MELKNSDNDIRYERIHEYNLFWNGEYLPPKIIDSLLDLPRSGYEPSDKGARADIMRLLYYDEPDALSRPAPTDEQRVEMVYRAEFPNSPKGEKGYRLYPEPRVSVPQERMKAELHIYAGGEWPQDSNLAVMAIRFDILVGMDHETLIDNRSRSLCIANRLKRAFNGVNITGIGTISYNSRMYRDCGMYRVTDQYYNVGYYLTMCCTVA